MLAGTCAPTAYSEGQQDTDRGAHAMAEEGLARGEDRQDDELAKAINDRLLSEDGLDGGAIQVHVTAGEATLTGDVDRQESRDRAQAIAAAVSGVEYVINNLRVAQEGTTGATG